MLRFEANPFLVKLSVEFDETSQMMRHRLGTVASLSIAASFPVMAVSSGLSV